MEFTTDELEKLAETHDIVQLTEEEERLIVSFREFKASKQCKPGSIFKWQTHPAVKAGELPRTVLTAEEIRKGKVIH